MALGMGIAPGWPKTSALATALVLLLPGSLQEGCLNHRSQIRARSSCTIKISLQKSPRRSLVWLKVV